MRRLGPGGGEGGVSDHFFFHPKTGHGLVADGSVGTGSSLLPFLMLV